MEDKKIQIRNSTIDFLVFTKDSGNDTIEVRVQDGNVWLTQKAIGQLFDVERSVITKHLKNIFESGELDEGAVCAKFAQTADDGKNYKYKFYSLSAIVAVGFRVNSARATQFRQWATKVLETFTKQGYVLDKNRLINGQIFDEDYFEHLISEVQEIRASERRFYQKNAGIYSDQGRTATNTKGRDSFNDMLEACYAGKIDLIPTKSISRFARNTVDCLRIIRELKERHIRVLFEKENIDTMDSTGKVKWGAVYPEGRIGARR